LAIVGSAAAAWTSRSEVFEPMRSTPMSCVRRLLLTTWNVVVCAVLAGTFRMLCPVTSMVREHGNRALTVLPVTATVWIDLAG
jgi:hypothetical protein